jgi:GDP-4-dehydro-6-deoxy-D-mannose reductase
VTGSALPVQETAPLQPITPYGLSKKLATEIALFYHRVGLLPVVVVRPFQLIGQGVTHRLAPGAFRDRLHEALRSGSGVIKVGNLESKRDFLDVRDAVDGIWQLCLNPAPGQVFNLCSGRAIRVGDLLDAMIEQLALDLRVETDPSLLRHAQDVPVIYGSIEKIHTWCGFTPKHSLRDSIVQMLAEDFS